MNSVPKEKRFILWFSEIGKADVALVGGKNASLGEMYNQLSPLGVKVPNGFAITTAAYEYFIDRSGIRKILTEVLGELTDDLSNLDEVARKARRLILGASMPKNLADEIGDGYRTLEEEFGGKKPLASRLDVAVRSSVGGKKWWEDMEGTSFAGQLETYLNIRGEKEVLDACLRCFASNFTARVIDYRQKLGYGHLDASVSVGIQKMVRSDKGSSGMAFTVDTNTGFSDVVIINAGFGLGELVVGGQMNPDEYIVSKTMLKKGYRPIIGYTVARKERKMIYAFAAGETTEIVPVPKNEQTKPALNEDEILKIAEWAMCVEEHYGKPMDIEWAKDGITGELFVVQARPATGIKKPSLDFDEYILEDKNPIQILQGVSIGDKIVSGIVNVIESFDSISEFKEGEILVTYMTAPSWEPAMRKAKAMITNDGGRKCHAAIIASEAGIPCIVGTMKATEVLKDGDSITIDCSQGEVGFIYKGEVPFHTEKISFSGYKKPKTQIMLFANKPLGIFSKFHIPNEGVGLARTEFIISEMLHSIHPMAWVRYPDVSEEVKQEIERYAVHYQDKSQYFIDKLAEAWGRIAATFYPKPVIPRLSDFRSNEYRDLKGGKEFERSDEENPMIGLRGAARYLHLIYSTAFRGECAAINKARKEFGFKNIIPMIPFCRTPEEGKKVLELMEEYGLKKGEDGLQVYMMVEIPSNFLLIDQFADIFDGFSIGSNDLTQLVYGVDRDSGELARLVDESHEGLRRAIKYAIDGAHAKSKKIGICGEAPSYLMDFTKFLVACGIDSITITSGSLGQYKKTAEAIKKFEEELGR